MATPLSTRLLDLARQDDSRAQYLYGKVRYLRRGVDKNLSDALNWLYRAATRGLTKPARLMLQAAKYGHKQAQACIANMYAEGLGVRRDSNEALYWSESAKSEKALL